MAKVTTIEGNQPKTVKIIVVLPKIKDKIFDKPLKVETITPTIACIKLTILCSGEIRI